MNYQKTIKEIYVESQEFPKIGEVSASIPELKNISPDKFGIFISTHEGTEFGKGDFQEKISIQSVSKVFTLCLAFSILGEKIWQRVNVEPSGNAFNSLVQLENEKGIPRNPFINAGAIVIADILLSHLKNPKEDFLEFIREISGKKNTCLKDKCLKTIRSRTTDLVPHSTFCLLGDSACALSVRMTIGTVNWLCIIPRFMKPEQT